MEGLFQASVAALQTAWRPVRLRQADSTAVAAEGIAGGKRANLKDEMEKAERCQTGRQSAGSGDSAWGRRNGGESPAWAQL